MRRPELAGFLFTTLCLAAACSANVPGVPFARAPSIRVGTERPTSREIVIPSGTLSLRGPIESAGGHSFIVLAARHHRVRVDITSRTTVVGSPRAGAFVQTVGEGTHPDRARYVAVWSRVPAQVDILGKIVSATALGFTLASDAQHVSVVLWSRTTMSSAPFVGENVRVEGSGSAARGIVAANIDAVQSPAPSPTATLQPTPAPSASPTPTAGPTPKPISIFPGEIVGTDRLFSPPDGDTPNGGQNKSVDGIPCAPSMSENGYHVHVYLGILAGGRQVAVPDQIGLYQPGNVVKGYTNTATCYYYIHTHDASGLIHIEVFSSPSPPPLNSSLYQLKNVLDVWGITVGPNNVGPFSGAVRTFVATVPLGSTVANNYSEYGGDPNGIALYSHEAIWLEAGPPYTLPPNLPAINFYNEY